MWNTPTKQQLDRIPRLYETEHITAEDKMIFLHFFLGTCDWYIAEYDGGDLFFGFAILNSDYEMAEWGYISFAEMKSISVDGLKIRRSQGHGGSIPPFGTKYKQGLTRIDCKSCFFAWSHF